MDINLPGMSGLDALNALRKDPSTARIPVIAISANAMPKDIKKYLKAGFFSYYTKPFFQDVAVEKSGRKEMMKVWAGIASAATWLLSNPKADVGVWTAVGGLLKNAFVQALMPTLDGTVHIADVTPAKN